MDVTTVETTGTQPIELDVEVGESSAPKIGEQPRSLSSLSKEERTEWRKTGKIPTAASPSPTESAASSAATEETPAATAASPKAASEPAETDPDYKPKTAKRISELLARAERAERELQRLAAPKPAPVVAVPTATADVEPDPTKYDDLNKYFKDLSAWQIRDHARTEAAKQATASQTAAQHAEAVRLEQAWQARADAAKAVDAAFDADATAKLIPARSLLDAWILEMPVDAGAAVLGYLGKHPAEVSRILKLPMIDQAEAIVRLKDTATAKPVLRTKTNAPDPGETLGTRTTAPDPVRAAIKRKDPRAYIREANKLEIAARRGH